METTTTCKHINRDSVGEYLREHGLTCGDLYRSADELPRHTLRLSPPAAGIINLPLDCYLEVEVFGGRLSGYDGATLAPITMPYAAPLPEPDLAQPRLRAVLTALEQIQGGGHTACLNLSGFAAVFDALYGSTLFYTEWHRSQAATLGLLEQMQSAYLEIMREATARGIRLISFAEPTLPLTVIGKRFAAGYAAKCLLPFLERVRASRLPLVFHICPLTTELLTLGGMTAESHSLTAATPMDQLLGELAATATEPCFIGNNCINTHRAVESYDRLVLP